VSRKDTGYATTAAAALTVVSDPGLGLTQIQSAQNAKFTIDGLAVERQSNSIKDVVAGAIFHLTGSSKTDSAVTFAANSANTEAALNTFVAAYNTLGATVRSQLVTDPTLAYRDTLLDHSSMTTIQSAMQRMLSQMVVPSGSVRILADLGLELQQDGTVTLNTNALNAAIASNPGAVNGIFTTTNTGMGDVIRTLVTNQTSAATGALITQQNSLQSNISDLDDRATQMQSSLDMERTRLVAQFTAMEQLISGFTSAGSYLTQIANLKIGG
jgi:flagellar hook-associated protein 2